MGYVLQSLFVVKHLSISQTAFKYWFSEEPKAGEIERLDPSAKDRARAEPRRAGKEGLVCTARTPTPPVPGPQS